MRSADRVLLARYTGSYKQCDVAWHPGPVIQWLQNVVHPVVILVQGVVVRLHDQGFDLVSPDNDAMLSIFAQDSFQPLSATWNGGDVTGEELSGKRLSRELRSDPAREWLGRFRGVRYHGLKLCTVRQRNIVR